MPKYPRLSDGERFQIDVRDLYGETIIFRNSAVDIRQGYGSRSFPKPIVVVRLGRSHFLLKDGYHRCLETHDDWLWAVVEGKRWATGELLSVARARQRYPQEVQVANPD